MATKPTTFSTGKYSNPAVNNPYSAVTPNYPVGDKGLVDTADPRIEKSLDKNLTPEASKLLKEKAFAGLDKLKEMREASKQRKEEENAKKREELEKRAALGDPNARRMLDKIDEADPGKKKELTDKLKTPKEPGKVAKLINKTDSALTKTKLGVVGAINLKGVYTLIKQGDFNSASGIAEALNFIADNNVVKVGNFTEDLLALNDGLSVLSDLGIISALDDFIDKKRSAKEKKKLLEGMVPTLFMTGNVTGILQAIEALGAAKVNALFPMGIQTLISVYRYPPNSQKNFPKHQMDLLTVFSKLSGNNWVLMKRNGNWITDTSNLVIMSKHFYQLFRYLDYSKISFEPLPGLGMTKKEQCEFIRDAVLVGKEYRIGNIEALLRQMYPKASFLFNRKEGRRAA